MPGDELIYSIKQGLSRFEHDLQNDFHTIVVRFQVRSITVCYGLVRLNTTFTRLAGHLQGLHTVSHCLSRSCTIANTIIHGQGTRVSFLKVRLSRIHSNGRSVTRIRPRLVRLYLRFTRTANRNSSVFCLRQA